MQLTKKAEELLRAIENEEELSEELSNFQEEISCSDGFEYGLIDGGYIKPEKILEGEDLIKFNEALKVYKELKEIWEKISCEL